jgi:excisionase family DNA binding protein
MERNGAMIRASELETINYAAEKLGVSRQRIAQMFDEGKLDFYRLGKRRMVHRRDIERLMRAKHIKKIAS